jgi:aryl-alcohol dehydrogenase-like predicted oxidoreductase
MLTSRFPRTGAEVSRLGYGGAAIGLTNYLGKYDAQANRAASVAVVRQAARDGLTYFDTAPGYGAGLSEEIFGEALEGVDGLTIATKVKAEIGIDVRASLEASLRRLRRPRIDLLQLHGGSIDRDTCRAILAPGGLLEQMVRLREEGLIAAVGFTSEDNNPSLYEMIECGGFDTMQIAYNLLLQHPYEPTRPFGSLFAAKEKGMFIVAMRTITSSIFQRWVRMANPADDFDYTGALIQFVLSNRLIDVALVGMRTPSDVESGIAEWRDTSGRIDVDALWGRYVSPPPS